MSHLERFLLSFEHPLDRMGNAVEVYHLNALKVGDVVRLFFRWAEGSTNKHYVRILEMGEGPVFCGETIEVYPQWSLCDDDGYRVPLGAKLRFEPRHVYEVPGFENGQIYTWPMEADEVDTEQETNRTGAADFIPLHAVDDDEVYEEEVIMVDSDYHNCSDGDDY